MDRTQDTVVADEQPQGAGSAPLTDALHTKRSHIKSLIAKAAKDNGVTYEAVMSRARPRDVCTARFAAIAAVAAAYPDMSFPRLGRIFNRDHSSIVHALMVSGVPPRSGRVEQYKKFAAAMRWRVVGDKSTEGETRNENT